MTKNYKEFVAALKEIANPKAVADVSRFFHADPNANSDGNKVLGVSIGKIFPIAKRFADMPLADVERLLDSPYYEVRMGAVRGPEAINSVSGSACSLDVAHHVALRGRETARCAAREVLEGGQRIHCADILIR